MPAEAAWIRIRKALRMSVVAGGAAFLLPFLLASAGAWAVGEDVWFILGESPYPETPVIKGAAERPVFRVASREEEKEFPEKKKTKKKKKDGDSEKNSEDEKSGKTRTMRSPVRLALGPRGTLFASDYANKRIYTLSIPNLKVLRAFSVRGRPLGLAWAQGRVFVGNESTSRVEVYTSDGRWLYDLGGASGEIRQPTDIAVDQIRGLVFVVDGHAKDVKVFEAEGALLRTIPGPGTEADRLLNPTGIALDEGQEEVLVSDYGDPSGYFGARIPARVQIYNYDGVCLGRISGGGSGGGMGMFGGSPRNSSFSRPQGLAVDGMGHIFLVDSLLGQVLVFERATQQGLKVLGSFGSGLGQLRLPLDVVVDRSSRDVYVTNNRAKRVEVFRKGGVIP